jgi:hypothetical protein
VIPQRPGDILNLQIQSLVREVIMYGLYIFTVLLLATLLLLTYAGKLTQSAQNVLAAPLLTLTETDPSTVIPISAPTATPLPKPSDYYYLEQAIISLYWN